MSIVNHSSGNINILDHRKEKSITKCRVIVKSSIRATKTFDAIELRDVLVEILSRSESVVLDIYDANRVEVPVEKDAWYRLTCD